MPAPPVYPPAHHILRDLRLTTELGPGPSMHGSLDITDHLRTPHGITHAGVLATVVDVLGGGLAAVAAAPDWIATADLTLHLLPRPGIRAVTATAAVVRQGRTTIVIDVRLGADGQPLGAATMTFAVLPRRDGNPVITSDDAPMPTTMALPSSGFAVDYQSAAGIAVRDGTAELAIDDYVRNSLGAVQGGIMATTAVSAAADAIGTSMTGRTGVVDLHVTFLALARVGPIRAVARLLAVGTDSGTARVELTDTGEHDLVTTIASARAVRLG